MRDTLEIIRLKFSLPRGPPHMVGVALRPRGEAGMRTGDASGRGHRPERLIILTSMTQRRARGPWRMFQDLKGFVLMTELMDFEPVDLITNDVRRGYGSPCQNGLA
jgi:hypothetical protein